MTTQNLEIRRFSTTFTSYGHWLIKMEVANPALTYSDDDEYWRSSDRTREEEPEYITIRHTTTNSRAIDGYDGFEQTLASECLRANDLDDSDFDMSSLRSEEED